MRVLFLMRGAPGVGKSTFIKENNLEQYSLCADNVRLLIQSPVLDINGNWTISQKNDKRVWELLFTMLEDRMKRGEFTIIDATNSKTVEMNRYKKLADKYRYRKYLIDFTDVPIEVVKERNRNRNSYKIVPEEVIDTMYARFKTQKVPSGFIVIKPEEFKETINNIYSIRDFSNYNKIHHIGDLHGCFTVLNEYLKNGLEDDELYIFVGDYLDRGIENADVLKLLLEIYTKENVILLTGNHEQYLYNYAHDLPGVSKEFEINTRPQLIEANFDKKDVRQLYRKFAQFAYYKYYNRIVLVTHGGLSCIPDNFVFISTEQLIKGIGDYKDMGKINESFLKNTNKNVYQIHGHRNESGSPIQINERCFNLCGKAEFGGTLRIVTLSKEGFERIEIPNTVYKQIEKRSNSIDGITIENLVRLLRDNKYIREKKFGNISSFNFTRDAFNDKIWDNITTKARGLFINTNTNKIVARSYNKFFNINEVEETKMKNLQNLLAYPLRIYVKYNGYLGIIGYDEENDDLVITSKTSLTGTFSDNFRRIFNNKIKNKDFMKKYLKENNLSFVVEVIDPINDPHIIEYENEDIILLDAIYRDMNYKKLSYDELLFVSELFNLSIKKLAFIMYNWNDFYNWYESVTVDDYKYNNKYIEGFVIEDANEFMFKMKLAYYNNWKFMRNVKDSVAKHGAIRYTGALTTKKQNMFYGWLKELPKEELELDIITLRKKFLAEKEKVLEVI